MHAVYKFPFIDIAAIIAVKFGPIEVVSWKLKHPRGKSNNLVAMQMIVVI